MLCRSCGTEISEKALICYRCGTATTEAKYKPAALPTRSPVSLVASVIALALLVLLALFMGRVTTGDVPRYASWLVVAAAVAVIALRAVARRRSNR